jgi:iron complex outermembrane recepter protein
VSAEPRSLLTLLLTITIIAASIRLAEAQTPQNSQLPVLKQLSIEELLQLDVTLPLRREERIMDAPAAVAVLTSEDVRRQGAVSLAEALRHVPGLFVGRFSASSWIVASRGFGSTTANKMLVMIDGRTVYSPLFSGVFWNQHDMMMLDIDRVELIRGPGASLWGSNAVNGVINVVSKRAADTQGVLLTVAGGAEERFTTALRYGGRAGAGHYRVYGKFFDRDDANLPGGVDAHDGQRLGQGGFKLEFEPAAHGFTLQGDVYRTRADTATDADIRADGANVLGRWTYRRSSRSELQVQGYFDRTRRVVPQQIDEARNTLDIEVLQRLNLNSRHTLSAGASYRHSADDTIASPLLAFDPAERTTHLAGAFAQDEFAISPAVLLVAGAKIEHNDFTGVEWQPSLRGRWMPNTAHTIWGAVSRAVRLPTRFDSDVRVFRAGLLVATGDPDFRSEEVVAFEAGYRTSPLPSFAVDVAVFHNRYNHLRSQELTGGRITVANMLNNNSTGATITATVQPRSWARFAASYNVLGHDLSLDRGSTDIYRGRFETIDPKHMARVQGRFDLPHGLEVDVMTMFIGRLPQIVPQIPGTPAYNEASFRAGWRINSRLEVSLIGRDVLHDDHIEFISPTSSRITRLERALFTRATLAF